MWLGWKLSPDGITGPHLTPSQHNPHHPSLANQLALPIPVQHCGHQPSLKMVELNTGVAQTGNFDYGLATNIKSCALG